MHERTFASSPHFHLSRWGFVTPCEVAGGVWKVGKGPWPAGFGVFSCKCPFRKFWVDQILHPDITERLCAELVVLPPPGRQRIAPGVALYACLPVVAAKRQPVTPPDSHGCDGILGSPRGWISDSDRPVPTLADSGRPNPYPTLPNSCEPNPT